ncbi:MAG: type III-A CRISPR-associated protein Csm2 [Nitrospinae bacterium]|nr:type III-A CRISPR-associated protein Csm2 [Nitrospinota bacterium]
MSELKHALEKAGIEGGGGMKKICRICKEPLKDDKFDTCYRCSQKNRGTYDSLPSDYLSKLAKGYFDEKGYLWEDFLTTMAKDVAKSFGTKLKSHQLRRFYGHAKAAEIRLKMTEDWDAVNVDVKKLEPFVSEAKGKDKIPQSFYEFIEKNIKAIKKRKDFEEGFMEHFQAVVAYFTYHYPKN